MVLQFQESPVILERQQAVSQEVLVVAGLLKEVVQGTQVVSMVQVVLVEVLIIVEVGQVEVLEVPLSPVVQLVLLSNLKENCHM